MNKLYEQLQDCAEHKDLFLQAVDTMTFDVVEKLIQKAIKLNVKFYRSFVDDKDRVLLALYFGDSTVELTQRLGR
jgi:hypothetical protein